MKKKAVVLILLIAGIYACNKIEPVIEEIFPGFQRPDHFPVAAYRFDRNEITEAGFKLGRKLFYDPILSANNTISCGSCHIQTSAFTQHGHSVSHGIEDRLGTRNSPPIMNLAWHTSFMWDGGVGDLDLQPIVPITAHEEMGENMANVLGKLQADKDYPILFNEAFGSSEITTANFMKALSQFMLMCISSNAKYDSVMRHEAVFTEEEQEGYLVFQSKCNACHKEPLFTDFSFRNNGIVPSTLDDQGRYKVTLQETDRYRFKVPSLRNLTYTAPYMHDGRLYTLEAVLDHYDHQVQPTPNLDALLEEGDILGIQLSAEERVNLITFLKTLDDRPFITNTLLSEQ